MGKDGANAHRVSATFTKQQHADLKVIAEKRGIGVAWLVRLAALDLIEREHGGPRLPLEGGWDAER
jgi:hypothetical protein